MRSRPSSLELNLAHKLRIQLWAITCRFDANRVFDGVASAVYWRDSPDDVKASANLLPYEYETGSVFVDRVRQVYGPKGWLDWSEIDPKP